MQPTPLTEKELTPFVSISLREGDVITISFPGSPNLNTSPQIRRDGKIDLPLGGELLAAGKTPAELEKELLEHFGPQLVVKEVSVAIKSSSYPVFVTGAVVRPGKLLADRPLHALEAIMEAGGFDLGRANLKAVAVIRIEEGQVKHYVLNLKLLLEGRTKDLFYLHPSDIIYVPEKAF
jgi:polysaccharide export outer membrane protein